MDIAYLVSNSFHNIVFVFVFVYMFKFSLIVKFSEIVDEIDENEIFSGLWCRIIFHTIVKQINSIQVLISF